MKILFDISHPAHVHFFKNIIKSLNAHGHICKIISRKKDVTNALLVDLRFDYISVGKSRKRSKIWHYIELFKRDFVIASVVYKFNPDLIMTRGPAGAQVGWLMGIPSIFDTDDGTAAKTLFSLAAKFASIITTPNCISENYGENHIKYPGYKQLAYLHPDHFYPNPQILKDLKISKGEKFFILRFVEMIASHDNEENGIPNELKMEIISKLNKLGKVFISSEGELPDSLRKYKFPLLPNKMHDALAFCDLFIGDSQTMAAEAAVLGVPNIRLSSWAGRLAYLNELENNYALTYAYQPEQVNLFLNHLNNMCSELKEQKKRMLINLDRLLTEKINTAEWFVDMVESKRF